MHSIPRTSGIYQILCVPTGKIYIGSAVNLRKRKNDHWSYLRIGNHQNRHLQRAWIKYGEDAFEFAVIELVLSSFVLEREQYWLDKLKPFGNRGFNLCPVAGSSYGVKRSDEFIAQMRTDRIGHKASEETRRRQSESHKGKKCPRTAEHSTKISVAALARFRDPKKREAIHGKIWEVVDPDKTVYITGNLAAFCREHSLTRRALAGVALGERNHHKGWTCHYLFQK